MFKVIIKAHTYNTINLSKVAILGNVLVAFLPTLDRYLFTGQGEYQQTQLFVFLNFSCLYSKLFNPFCGTVLFLYPLKIERGRERD